MNKLNKTFATLVGATAGLALLYAGGQQLTQKEPTTEPSQLEQTINDGTYRNTSETFHEYKIVNGDTLYTVRAEKTSKYKVPIEKEEQKEYEVIPK